MRTNRLLCTFLSLLALAGSMGAASRSTRNSGLPRNSRHFWDSGMGANPISRLYRKPTEQELQRLNQKDSPNLGDDEFETLMANSTGTVGDFVRNNTLANILSNDDLNRELRSIMQKLSPEERQRLRTALLKQHKDAHRHQVLIGQQHLNNLNNPADRTRLSDPLYRNKITEAQVIIDHEEQQFIQDERNFSEKLDEIIRNV